MPLETSDLAFVRDLVVKQSGNQLRQGQERVIESQLNSVAKGCGMRDAQQLVNRLRMGPERMLTEQVAQALTINETSFFRDAHPFEVLRTHIIPSLLDHGLKNGLRIWCAACSTGQEPISLAIVLRESFPALCEANTRIIATDISDEVLAKSKSGEYTHLEVGRGLSPQRRERFFQQQGQVFRAKPELRNLIEYRRLNLISPFPAMQLFDVVFLRNVLIYFDKAGKADILSRVRRAMRPQSYLFIGSTETTIGLGAPFKREEIDATVCYRPESK